MIGRVVSVKKEQSLNAQPSNTVVVLVERIAKHPFYHKGFARSKRYLVDDKIGTKEGDVVEIINCKPISKNKHWKVIKVVGKDMEAIIKEQLKQGAEDAIAEVMPEEVEVQVSAESANLPTENADTADQSTTEKPKKRKAKK